MTLRVVATQPHEGMNLARLNELLAFLEGQLSEPDFTEAQSLLEAAICPHHSAKRHRERAEREAAEGSLASSEAPDTAALTVTRTTKRKSQ